MSAFIALAFKGHLLLGTWNPY